MRFGVLASVLLHVCAVGLAFLSLPEFLRTKVVDAPVIPVELIREAELAEKTSVPAAAAKPKPKPPEEKKAPLEEKKPEPAKVEEKKAEPKKEPPPAELKKEPEKKTEPKKDPPKKDKPKKPDDLDLDALEALIDKSRKSDPQTADDPGDTDVIADKARESVGAGDRLTASDIDKMRAAVSRCWNASAIIGAPEPEKLIVELDIDLNRDGSLAGPPKVVNSLEINLSGNRFWKVAEQNAVRAVQACQPYDFFDQARYQEWKAFTLNFDPSIMAGF